jgi:hypothetical protein
VSDARLTEAVHALTSGEGTVKQRVVVACKILRPMMQLNNLAESSRVRLRKVLDAASTKGPQSNSSGVWLDAFDNTAVNKRNSTYVGFAKEIFSVWLECMNQFRSDDNVLHHQPDKLKKRGRQS